MREIINGIDIDRLRELLREVENNIEHVSKTSRWIARARWLGQEPRELGVAGYGWE